jgi:hypothetical protein
MMNLGPDLPGSSLNAPDQFILLALYKLPVVVGEPGQLLFQAAFGNVPDSFGLEHVHTFVSNPGQLAHRRADPGDASSF